MRNQRGFEIVSRFEGEDLKLPERSTTNSAGYDFFAPEDIYIPSQIYDFTSSGIDVNPIVKPFCLMTGIKAYMQKDEVLQLYVRSSMPGKMGLVLANSVGIIDSDYYNNPDNEGEIGFLLYNLNKLPISIKKGDKIGQGVFQKFLITDDDSFDTNKARLGGFGSTGE